MTRRKTDEYDSLHDLDAGRKRRWADGWLVRDVRTVERGTAPVPDLPATNGLGGTVLVGAFALLFGGVAWLLWRKRPQRTFVVTYEKDE